MEVTGRIYFIGETQVVSDKFTKKEVVLEILDNPQYPQHVLFQFTQDKCALLDLFKVGQDASISFNLRGRAWTNPQGEVKYFNTLEGWRIVPIGQTQTPPQAQAPKGGVNPANIPSTPVVNIESLDDLPF